MLIGEVFDGQTVRLCPGGRGCGPAGQEADAGRPAARPGGGGEVPYSARRRGKVSQSFMLGC